MPSVQGRQEQFFYFTSRTAMTEFTGVDVLLALFGVNCTSYLVTFSVKMVFYIVRFTYLSICICALTLEATKSTWSGEVAIDSATSMLLYLASIVNQQIWLYKRKKLIKLRKCLLEKMNSEDKKSARRMSYICLSLYLMLLILLFSTNCNSAFFELSIFSSLIIYTHLATCVHLASIRILKLAQCQSQDLLLAGLEVTSVKNLHEKVTNLHPILGMTLLFGQFHIIVKLICRSSLLGILKSPHETRVIGLYLLCLILWFLVTYIIELFAKSQEKTVNDIKYYLLTNNTEVTELLGRDLTLDVLTDAGHWHLTGGHMIEVDSGLILRFIQAVVTFTAIFLDVLGLI